MRGSVLAASCSSSVPPALACAPRDCFAGGALTYFGPATGGGASVDAASEHDLRHARGRQPGVLTRKVLETSGAPRPTKMGTIRSPWRYDLIRQAATDSETLRYCFCQ